jgi:hypothetical protein
MASGFDYRGDNAFAAQFTPDGDEVVYRYNHVGPALPLSSDERDRFIAAFRAGYGKLFWRSVAAMVGVTVIAIVAQIALQLSPEDWVAEVGLFVGLMPGMALLVVGFRRLTAAPAVALAARTPVAAPLPVAAFRRAQLAATPWWRFVPSLMISAVLTWRFHLIDNPLAPHNLVFSVLVVGSLALVVVQGFRKWRAGASPAA